ncbi:MAG: response regulator [Nitrospirae bacterium]|nr:MAG: response regulator [Nitrospirota bacterium]
MGPDKTIVKKTDREKPFIPRTKPGSVKVLVVDDEQQGIKMLSAMLAENDYLIATANSGYGGYQAARSMLPDIILLDVFMPDIDGLKVCAMLRKTPETRHIPIIIVTGSDDITIRSKCIEAGANDFLSKPVDPVELNTRIRNLLFLRHYERVTDENKALAESRDLIEKSRQEWEDTFDSLEDIITIHDADYNILKANRAARDLLGVDIQSAPAHLKCYQYYHKTDTPHPDCPVKKSIKTGRPAMSEYYEPALGKHLEVRVIPRYDSSGLATGYIHVVRDITESKKTHEALESAYTKLKEAHSQILQQEKMASIGQLAAGVAHEINNPTGFIMSNLGSLQKYVEKLTEFMMFQSEAVSPDKAEAVAKKRKEFKLDFISEDIHNLIKESIEGAERIKRIVQDLKSFSRVDEADEKQADINAGIESTVNIVWNELKYKAVVKKDYGDIPLTRCSPGQLNQVFMNLLVNAAHAIEKRGEISIKTWEDGGNIFATVSDTGSGIPADKLNRIFEPFYTTKEVGKGTGLGLSIAYDIVQKHNGEISVESEVGKGTTFTVKIPVVSGPKEKGTDRGK